MTANNHSIKTLLDRSSPFPAQLRKIFAAMDQVYDLAAGQYGFQCEGCEDNCCRTRFFHHTFLEYLYLYDGFKNLNPDLRADIEERAELVVREMALAGKKGVVFKMMCPLNHDGRCAVYEHRPMICRMHGIPHELQKPGQDKDYGSGCHDFTNRFGKETYFPFDRTPFYLKIAGLESELKKTLSITDRFKMTVAQMVVSWNRSGLKSTSTA